MPLSTDQKGVVGRVAVAAPVTLAVALLAVFTDILPIPVSGDPAGRLALAAACALVPVVALILAVGRVANHRFFTPEDIHGSGLTQGSERAKIFQAILQNTLEQACLAVFTYSAAAILLPGPWLDVIPASVFLFVLGRILFAKGYSAGAPGRALGFGLTFYPTVVLVVLTAVGAFVG
jgi:hypothetical protein